MNSLVKVIVVIYIIGGSTASLPSPVDSVESSALKVTGNFNIINLLSSLVIKENGLCDLKGLIQKLNLPTTLNTTSILSSLNVTTNEDGQLDLKSLLKNFDLSNINFKDVLGLLNVKIINGVVDFTDLIQKITRSGSLSQYLDSAINASEDARLDFTGLGEKYNMSVKEYNVTTKDGYILKVFRIPGDTSKAVLVSHGFLSTSDDFIIRGYTSLVYILAQSGYDVWVMNYRGSRYSRNHKTLDPNKDYEYWQFSLHELGYYDLPAVIDYVLCKTKQKQLSVVGHSEGTAAVFALTSTRTEYNDKIKIFVALSPVCYLSDTGTAMKVILKSGIVLTKVLKALNYLEFVGYESNERKLIQFLCSQDKLGYELCFKAALEPSLGYNPDNTEAEFFNIILGHYPAGTSLKNFEHYDQISYNDRFAQFDYGPNNTDIYGSEDPPLYDFQKVTCNITLFGGKNDKILGLKDFNRVKDQIVNLVNYYLVEDELFNHIDFTFGRNAHQLVYKQVIEELNMFN